MLETLRESAELSVNSGYPLRLVDILELGGHLCATTGRPAEAVTLWAARAAQCRAAGVVEPPRPRPSTLPKLRLARGAVR